MRFKPVILCVDDDEDDLFFIKEAIRSGRHNFEIAEAQNGWEALSYLEAAVESGQLPCLVIMDMNMPKMNGRQTIDKIRSDERLAGLPVAVFTTSSNIAYQKYFESHGIHFITKPFYYKVFTRKIVDLLAYCADLGA